MQNKLVINLKKRKRKAFDFYYRGFGQIIKKRRNELKYTQEYVAKAICSDTYISKAENSQVVMGNEQFYRIMEKLDISREEFSEPETLIYYLDQIIKYFYHRDIDSYSLLIDKVKGYHFHVIIEIIKLGYHILKEEYEEAMLVSDQLYDYLISMDCFAFSVFLNFSSILNVKLNNINLASQLINAINILHLDYVQLINIYLSINYIVLGKSHKFTRAEQTYNELIPKLVNTHNSKLVKEVMVWKALFKEYENDGDEIDYLEDFIEGVDESLVDEYLLIRAFNTSEPEKYVRYMKNKEGEKYLIALYLSSKKVMKNEDKGLYNKYQEEISKIHYKTGSKIDYNKLLNLEKNENLSYYKEYLANTCLKTAKSNEDIFFLTKINEKIVQILKSKNRYKDALKYEENLKEQIRLIQED